MALVIDSFVNVLSERAVTQLATRPEFRGLDERFATAGSWSDAAAVEQVLAAMRTAGVDRSIVTTGLVDDGLGLPESSGAAPGAHAESLLAQCREHPEHLRAALTVDRWTSIRTVVQLLERFGSDPALCAFRVVPMLSQLPIDDRTWYPVYERCEALQVPVTINVGLPGPRVKGRCQHPLLLDEVLVDFPDLVVVAAHMGHPWEPVVLALLAKFPNLYLMTSAYLAKYFSPEVLAFMGSSRGADRVLFASDAPLLPVDRALAAARALDLPPDALERYLGANAARVFRWPDERT